jgi:hypothetical protein
MPKLAWLAAALTLFLAAPAALAAGTAVGVDPDAEARGNGTRTLVVGDDVFIGDRIVTDARGLVQILFDDKTKLVVGPRSSLVIEDYLLRENGSAGRLAVNALSGTFRFITGGSPKDRYVINTPTGQIGVRGSAADFYVTKSATYWLQLHGAMVLCSRSGDCETLNEACEYAEIGGGGIEMLDHVRDLDRGDREDAKTWFRFSTSQSALLRAFRVSGADRCMRGRAVQAEPPGSISGPIIVRPRKKPVDEDTDSDGGDSGTIF